MKERVFTNPKTGAKMKAKSLHNLPESVRLTAKVALRKRKDRLKKKNAKKRCK